MKRLITLLVMALASTQAFSRDLGPSRNALEFTSTYAVVPVMANLQGVTGSFFRTRVALMNPTAFTYPIEISFYGVSGFVSKTTLSMAAGQLRIYDNFLEEIFSFIGAGTVKFESERFAGGSTNFQFLLNSEVWTTSANGRYGTTVPTNFIEASNSDAYSAGIKIDASTRSNIGCFNNSSLSNVIEAAVFDSSNNLVTTITLTLDPTSWKQVSIPNAVSSGYVRFRPSQPAFCYAVVVNNTTNDGNFIPAAEYAP